MWAKVEHKGGKSCSRFFKSCEYGLPMYPRSRHCNITDNLGHTDEALREELESEAGVDSLLASCRTKEAIVMSGSEDLSQTAKLLEAMAELRSYIDKPAFQSECMLAGVCNVCFLSYTNTQGTSNHASQHMQI